jgi:hypothetical protein
VDKNIIIMGKNKAIETPEKIWELNLPKNKKGNYIIVPKKRNYSGITITNRRKKPNGYIYFIKGENTNFYKLGVSENPKRRICDIDSYLPFNLEILSLHYFKNIYDIEDFISLKIDKYKIRREWYNLTIEQAKDLMIELHNLNIKKDASDKNI